MAIKEFEIGHKFGPYEITYDEKSSDAYSKAIKIEILEIIRLST